MRAIKITLALTVGFAVLFVLLYAAFLLLYINPRIFFGVLGLIIAMVLFLSKESV